MGDFGLDLVIASHTDPMISVIRYIVVLLSPDPSI